MDGAERQLFESGLRDATAAHDGPALDAALTKLGWFDALAVDPRVAVSLLFEHQGRANATSSALESVLASALELAEYGAVCVLLPAPGSGEVSAQQAEDRFLISGLAPPTLKDADQAVAIVAGSRSHRAVAMAAAGLTQRPVGGLDTAAGLLEVTGALPVGDAAWTAPVDWPAALALGRRALGHELVGASRAMLELARHHALERQQFGRPIASFQALRHRLADCLVAIEAADALLGAAWDEPSPTNAAMAKAFAGRTARLAARHCQQVLAGMGFTAEHPFHRYLRRTLLLDQLLGAGHRLTGRLGADVIDSGRLPPAVDL